MSSIKRLDGGVYLLMALSFVLVPIGSTLLLGKPLPKIRRFALGRIIPGVTLSAMSP